MKLLNKPIIQRARLYQSTLVIAILFAGVVVQSDAQVYTLAIRDTSMQIDLANGITQWTIDGVNQLNLQSLYYSVGSGPAASIYTIAPWSTPTLTTNLGKTQITLNNETYANSIISVGTKYVLGSGLPGSGQATLGQTLTINNLSSTAQVFHFYQYSDFDLGGVSGGQNVHFYDNGSGQYYQVIQSGLGPTLTGLISSVNGGSNTMSEVQAGWYDGNKFGLGSGSTVTLDNTLTAGPTNVVYAYEWDATLAPGASIIISEIQTIVPEPSSVALVASGMFAVALFCRRRQGG